MALPHSHTSLRGETVHLRLYMAGQSPNSVQALANLTRLCDERLGCPCHVEIIDVVRNPQLAATDGISVLPALVRPYPLPALKVTGVLSDFEYVITRLQLPDEHL